MPMAIGLVVLFSSQKMPQEDDLAAQKEPVRGVQIKGGDVIMIGPLPIVMGSDSKTAHNYDVNGIGDNGDLGNEI
jgi:uncharacterized protein (TIGR00304 family)